MDFQQIRKYVKGVLTNSFLNKTTLDKLSTSDEGNLLFNGKGINSNSVEWNQIQTEGAKIAEVTIDGIATEIFVPNGGKGSRIVVDTLIDATITTTDSYELSANIDNYDMLIVTGMVHINSSDYEQLNSLIIMKDDYYIETGDGWSHLLNFSISGSSTRRAVFNFNDGKLNVVKIENAALKKIYGIKFVSQQHEYSTEEKVVGTWIDGKPIYEKVIYIENFIIGDNEIPLENLDTIINYSGNLIFTDYPGYKRVFPYIQNNSASKVVINHYNNTKFVVASAFNCNTIYISIQYTKTTD